MSSNSSHIDGATALEAKVDLFFRLHILPDFPPERIHWGMSLSGGKDSFAMSEAVREWYLRRKIPFSATCFRIDQWGAPAAQDMRHRIGARDLTVLDGKRLTFEKTGYRPGQQAPCRSCSDARHEITDAMPDGAQQRPTALTL